MSNFVKSKTYASKASYADYKKIHRFNYIQSAILIYSPKEVDNNFLTQVANLEKSEQLTLLQHTLGLTGHPIELKSAWAIYLIEQLAHKDKISPQESHNFYDFIAKKFISGSLYSVDLIDWAADYLYEHKHSFVVPNAITAKLVQDLIMVEKNSWSFTLSPKHEKVRSTLTRLSQRSQIDNEYLKNSHEKELLLDFNQHFFQQKPLRAFDNDKRLDILKNAWAHDHLTQFLAPEKIFNQFLSKWIEPELTNMLHEREQLVFINNSNNHHNPMPHVLESYRNTMRFYRSYFKQYDLKTELQKNTNLQRLFFLCAVAVSSISSKDKLIEDMAKNYGDGTLLKHKSLGQLEKEYFSHINFDKWPRLAQLEIKSLQKTFSLSEAQIQSIINSALNAYEGVKTAAHRPTAMQSYQEKMIVDLFLEAPEPQSGATGKKFKV